MNQKLRIGLCWFARIVIFGAGTYVLMSFVIVSLFVSALFGIPFSDGDKILETSQDQFLLWSVPLWIVSIPLYWFVDRFFHKPKTRFLFVYISIVQLLFFAFIGYYFLDSLRECVDYEQEMVKEFLSDSIPNEINNP